MTRRAGLVAACVRLRNKPHERFVESYIPEPTSGCWLWLGRARSPIGYGSIAVGGRLIQAHRYSWEIHHGQIPNGMLVLHRCDVAACVNPDHLFLGTVHDNIADKLAKGRQRSGNQYTLKQRKIA